MKLAPVHGRTRPDVKLRYICNDVFPDAEDEVYLLTTHAMHHMNLHIDNYLNIMRLVETTVSNANAKFTQ